MFIIGQRDRILLREACIWEHNSVVIEVHFEGTILLRRRLKVKPFVVIFHAIWPAVD